MVLCIIQARMGSSRLPQKVVKDIMESPMISIMMRRLKKSRYIDKLVLATSTNQENDVLEQIVSRENVEVFRGDEENVLKRYVDVVNQYDADVVVRLTGDCPLIDIDILDTTIGYFLSNQYDYVNHNIGVRGFDVEVFSKMALLKASAKAHDKKYTEHVTSYMYTHEDDFKCKALTFGSFYDKDYRVCVDTDEDFEVVRKIFEHFNNFYVGAKDVVQFLDDNKDIANINANVVQKKYYEV